MELKLQPRATLNGTIEGANAKSDHDANGSIDPSTNCNAHARANCSDDGRADHGPYARANDSYHNDADDDNSADDDSRAARPFLWPHRVVARLRMWQGPMEHALQVESFL